MKKIIVAIDGFSACGKSTFARALAAQLGYVFIDTGAMYRAVTLLGIENGLITGGVVDQQKLIGLLDGCHIEFRFDPARGASDLWLDGRNVEGAIRGGEVSGLVSCVSRICEVRTRLVEQQHRMGRQRGIVMDGRDIGTVVFPEAELKIFMTASIEVRTRRRYDELVAKGEHPSLEEVARNLAERDHADQTRAVSPLRQAPDALVLDNSRMTLDQELEWVRGPLDRLGVR